MVVEVTVILLAMENSLAIKKGRLRRFMDMVDIKVMLNGSECCLILSASFIQRSDKGG